MAIQKRIKKTKEDKQPTRQPSRCFRCDGTGLICDICGESETTCQCGRDQEHEEVTYSDCEDCEGTGE